MFQQILHSKTSFFFKKKMIAIFISTQLKLPMLTIRNKLFFFNSELTQSESAMLILNFFLINLGGLCLLSFGYLEIFSLSQSAYERESLPCHLEILFPRLDSKLKEKHSLPSVAAFDLHPLAAGSFGWKAHKTNCWILEAAFSVPAAVLQVSSTTTTIGPTWCQAVTSGLELKEIQENFR